MKMKRKLEPSAAFNEYIYRSFTCYMKILDPKGLFFLTEKTIFKVKWMDLTCTQP